MTANYLFTNRGGFRFAETGQIAGAAASADGGFKAGMGIALGDLDGDGLIDLAVTNYFGESDDLLSQFGPGFLWRSFKRDQHGGSDAPLAWVWHRLYRRR